MITTTHDDVEKVRTRTKKTSIRKNFSELSDFINEPAILLKNLPAPYICRKLKLISSEVSICFTLPEKGYFFNSF